jgi:hypothetical protein
MYRIIRLLIVALFVANLTAACTTHQRVQTDTVQYENRSRTGEPVAVETKSTTTTTTETQGTEDSGVLSSTVNVIGEIIALPFRAVAGLFRAIF